MMREPIPPELIHDLLRGMMEDLPEFEQVELIWEYIIRLEQSLLMLAQALEMSNIEKEIIH